eukprot:567334-Pleurochrysis_carterae.AAC.1
MGRRDKGARTRCTRPLRRTCFDTVLPTSSPIAPPEALCIIGSAALRVKGPEQYSISHRRTLASFPVVVACLCGTKDAAEVDQCMSGQK